MQEVTLSFYVDKLTKEGYSDPIGELQQRLAAGVIVWSKKTFDGKSHHMIGAGVSQEILRSAPVSTDPVLTALGATPLRINADYVRLCMGLWPKEAAYQKEAVASLGNEAYFQDWKEVSGRYYPSNGRISHIAGHWFRHAVDFAEPQSCSVAALAQVGPEEDVNLLLKEGPTNKKWWGRLRLALAYKEMRKTGSTGIVVWADGRTDGLAHEGLMAFDKQAVDSTMFDGEAVPSLIGKFCDIPENWLKAGITPMIYGAQAEAVRWRFLGFKANPGDLEDPEVLSKAKQRWKLLSPGSSYFQGQSFEAAHEAAFGAAKAATKGFSASFPHVSSMGTLVRSFLERSQKAGITHTTNVGGRSICPRVLVKGPNDIQAKIKAWVNGEKFVGKVSLGTLQQTPTSWLALITHAMEASTLGSVARRASQAGIPFLGLHDGYGISPSFMSWTQRNWAMEEENLFSKPSPVQQLLELPLQRMDVDWQNVHHLKF